MRIADLNWMQVEAYLKRDDRCVLPFGCTEQHAYLSLATDTLLAERVAVEAAEPLGVPVFPPLAYGFTPNFAAYPGTVSLRFETVAGLMRDVLDALAAQGFRRVLVVNGHGGNAPAQAYAHEWLAAHPGMKVRWHNWWNAPQVWAQVQATDPVASHASWMENFPWTRLADVEMPQGARPEQPYAAWLHLGPQAVREKLGDGNFAGRYARPDDDMLAIWRVAVAETRARITDDWS